MGTFCLVQSEALVCIERLREADFSNISSEQTSAFLRRGNDSKRCGQDWLGGSPGSCSFLGRVFRSRIVGLARENGFPATQPGHHIVARAQEHILTAGCRVDARVGLLESAFVTLTLSEGRQRASGTSRRHTNERRHSTAIPAEVPRDSLGADGPDQFGRGVPETSSDVEERPSLAQCGDGFRHNLTVTLQERCREVGWRQGRRRASLESVRPRTCNVVAQTKRGRQHRSS